MEGEKIYKALFGKKEVELSSEKVELGKLQDIDATIKKALSPVQSIGGILSEASSKASRAAADLDKAESEASKLVSNLKELGVDGQSLKKAQDLEEKAFAFKESMRELAKSLDSIKKKNYQ